MADRKQTPECPDNEPPKKFVILPPVKPVPDCDPPLEIPETDYNTPDAPQPDPPPPTAFPLQIPVFADDRTVSCANRDDGSTGVDVILSGEDAGPLPFFFQDIPELTSTELRFIRQRQDENFEQVTAVVEDGTVEEIAEFLHISITKAGFVDTAYQAVEKAADDKAQATAEALLVCRWGNTYQTLSCADTYPEEVYGVAIETGYDINGVANNPVEVEADQYFSLISQQDADDLAKLAMTAQLVCIWGSDGVDVKCSDVDHPRLDPGKDDLASDSGALLGVEDPDHPTTPFPGVDGRYRVNQVVIAPGEYESPDSGEIASTIARDIALALLDCFYVNPEVVAECPPPESGEEPAGWDPITYDGSNTGNPVTVSEGYVASEISWEAAEEEAEDLAVSALFCEWRSHAMAYACDDLYSLPGDELDRERHWVENYPTKVVNDETGETALDFQARWFKGGGKDVYVTSMEATLDMMASPVKSVPYSIVVEHGFFTSNVSQKDADELAANFAVAQLICIYCNPRIDPVCPKLVDDEADPDYGLIVVPPGEEAGLPRSERIPETMTLPIPAHWVDGTWSMDATLGVPGIVYVPGESGEDVWIANDEFFEEDLDDPVKTFQCSVDPFEAVTVADILGMVPVTQMSPASRNDHCQYGNVPHYAACKLSLLPDPYDVPDDSVLFTASSNWSEYYSPNSTKGYVVVPKDSVQAASSDDANALARIQALSILNCYFETPSAEIYCGATTANKTLPPAGNFSDPSHNPGPFIVPPRPDPPDPTGPGYIKGSEVHYESVGSWPSDSARLPKPVILPYGYGVSYVSPNDAWEQALLLGLGQLDCFWKNKVYTAKCPHFDEPYPDNIFKTGAITSKTVAKDTYRSYDSQGDAENQAQLSAESGLLCLYTNVAVTGKNNCDPTTEDALLVTVPEQFATSSLDTPDATKNAGLMADAMTQCITRNTADGVDIGYLTSPFGVSPGGGGGGGGGDPNCCEVDIDRAAEETKFFMPQAPTILKEIEFKEFPYCAEKEGGTEGISYVYLEIELTYSASQTSDQLKWDLKTGTSVTVRHSNFVVNDINPPAYPPSGTYTPADCTVRRVIAEVHCKKEDCSDLRILQSVDCAQKLIVAYTIPEGKPYPMIVDKTTPEPMAPGVAPSGAFFGMRRGANNNIYLQGGTVTAGDKTSVVAEFQIYDGTAGTWSGSPEQHVQLTVNGRGQVTNGILDPIFNGSDDTIVPTIDTTVPGDKLPVADNTDGIVHISLGSFFGQGNVSEGFLPAQAGNRYVSFCWGGFTVD